PSGSSGVSHLHQRRRHAGEIRALGGPAVAEVAQRVNHRGELPLRIAERERAGATDVTERTGRRARACGVRALAVADLPAPAEVAALPFVGAVAPGNAVRVAGDGIARECGTNDAGAAGAVHLHECDDVARRGEESR